MSRNNPTKPPFEQHLAAYRKATKKGRGEILDNFERVYGRPRKSLIRSFNRLLAPHHMEKLLSQPQVNIHLLFSIWPSFSYNKDMELTARELPKILEYYKVDKLGLIFDGFEPVDPDKLLYYWHDPKTGELYVALLADFIVEFIDNSEPGDIIEDYWPEHECNWQVEHWFCSDDDTNNFDDYDKWFYWPECGDKCAFAKLKANVSEIENRKLERKVPDIDEAEMNSRKVERQKLTIIDCQAHS